MERALWHGAMVENEPRAKVGDLVVWKAPYSGTQSARVIDERDERWVVIRINGLDETNPIWGMSFVVERDKLIVSR